MIHGVFGECYGSELLHTVLNVNRVFPALRVTFLAYNAGKLIEIQSGGIRGPCVSVIRRQAVHAMPPFTLSIAALKGAIDAETSVH